MLVVLTDISLPIVAGIIEITLKSPIYIAFPDRRCCKSIKFGFLKSSFRIFKNRLYLLCKNRLLW